MKQLKTIISFAIVFFICHYLQSQDKIDFYYNSLLRGRNKDSFYFKIKGYDSLYIHSKGNKKIRYGLIKNDDNEYFVLKSLDSIWFVVQAFDRDETMSREAMESSPFIVIFCYNFELKPLYILEILYGYPQRLSYAKIDGDRLYTCDSPEIASFIKRKNSLLLIKELIAFAKKEEITLCDFKLTTTSAKSTMMVHANLLNIYSTWLSKQR